MSLYFKYSVICFRFSLTFLFFSFLNFKNFSQDTTLVFDRPGISDSPYLAKDGCFLLESGFNVKNKTTLKQTLKPSLLLRMSLFKNGEIRLSYNTLPQSIILNQLSEDITSEIFSLGCKYKLLKEDSWIPEAALMVNFSGFNLENYKNDFCAETYLLLHHNITDKFGFNSNIGFIKLISPDTDLAFFSACVNYNLHHKFGFFVESFNYYFFQRSFTETAFDLGLIFMIHDKCQLDFSYILNRDQLMLFKPCYNVGLSIQF